MTDDRTIMAGACTDWSRYEVPTLWAMTVGEDGDAHWRHITAWYRTEDLLVGYRKRLEACREALIEKWPPERSPAAQAFLGRLGEMIMSVTDAIDMASRNAGALTGMSNALMLARDELRPIYQRWLGYEQAEADAVEAAQYVTLGEVQPTGIPQDWRENLNQQARSVIWRAEQDFFQSAQRMTVPITFAQHVQDTTSQISASNIEFTRGSNVNMPTVPDNTSGPPAVVTNDSDKLVLAVSPEIPTQGEIHLAGHEVRSSADIASSRHSTFVPPLANVGPVADSRIGGKQRWLGAWRKAGEFGNIETVRSNPVRSTEMGFGERGRLPGGLVSPLGGGVLGSRVRDERTSISRRANPVGGVIGPPSGTTTGGYAFWISETRDRGEDAGHAEGTTWSTAKGVPPVLEPPAEIDHQVGPGVIGVDR